MVKKYSVTENRSLDGVLSKLNSKKVSEFGEVEGDQDSDSDDDQKLPGAKKQSQTIKRNTKLAVRVKDVKFAPDGKSFA